MRLDELQRQMDAGATLLVPNQRAARGWRRRIFDPSTATTLPQVLPWAAWTAAQWQTPLLNGDDDRLLLNSLQHGELWTRILQDSRHGTLLPTRSLVRLCLAAQHLVHAYGCAGRLLAFRGDPGTDTAVFADWFRTYTAQCNSGRFLASSALDDALSAHFSKRIASVPETLFLLGFDWLSPTQLHLLDALRSAGTRVESLDPADLVEVQPQRGTLLRCADAQQEWMTLAHDLREEVQATEGKAHVLLVLPDEEASRAALDRTLRASLGEGKAPLWEFATGQSVAMLPLTATALQVLRWAAGPLAATNVGALLRSPFLHLGVLPEAAGELDAELLRADRRLKPEWTVEDLARTLRSRVPALTEALLRLQQTASRQLKGEHLPGIWAERIRGVLTAAGWPGTRERTSAEFQLIDRWQELLEGVASLDLFDRSMPFADYFERLEAAASETLFAAENTGAPIQIVSPSEAAGTLAETVWFAHATETKWNARRTPSALLPWPLQQELGMPGTDAAQDLEVHRRTTGRLLRSGRTTIVSYAAANEDGECRAAAVLDQFPMLQHRSAAALPEEAEPAELEEVLDNAPLPALPPGSISGGVGVLKDQAACAFRAFAERRLFSSEPEEATFGLDARERGDLLHRVLHLFWRETESQGELLRLRADGRLAETLGRHIDATLSTAVDDRWDAAYLEVQRSRLHVLLMKWFELEAQRPPFRVLYTEHGVNDVRLGPLHLNLRVDRIDEVSRNGEPTLTLIDYKTGSPHPSEWMGERPDEPQLPVYAVAADLESVGAIAFATVRAGTKQLGLRAFPAKSDLLFSGGKDDQPAEFEAQMEAWHATVSRLAEEFAAGDVRVGPKQYPATCTHCGQRMLCRLNPELLQDLSVEEEESD